MFLDSRAKNKLMRCDFATKQTPSCDPKPRRVSGREQACHVWLLAPLFPALKSSRSKGGSLTLLSSRVARDALNGIGCAEGQKDSLSGLPEAPESAALVFGFFSFIIGRLGLRGVDAAHRCCYQALLISQHRLGESSHLGYLEPARLIDPVVKGSLARASVGPRMVLPYVVELKGKISLSQVGVLGVASRKDVGSGLLLNLDPCLVIMLAPSLTSVGYGLASALFGVSSVARILLKVVPDIVHADDADLRGMGPADARAGELAVLSRRVQVDVVHVQAGEYNTLALIVSESSGPMVHILCIAVLYDIDQMLSNIILDICPERADQLSRARLLITMGVHFACERDAGKLRTLNMNTIECRVHRVMRGVACAVCSDDDQKVEDATLKLIGNSGTYNRDERNFRAFGATASFASASRDLGAQSSGSLTCDVRYALGVVAEFYHVVFTLRIFAVGGINSDAKN